MFSTCQLKLPTVISGSAADFERSFNRVMKLIQEQHVLKGNWLVGTGHFQSNRTKSPRGGYIKIISLVRNEKMPCGPLEILSPLKHV